MYDAVHALWRECKGVGLHDGSDSREGIQSYLERNPGMSFGAIDGDAIVGAVLCGHDGRRGYIHHVAVHPARRRQGLGRALVDKCLATLRARGIPKCHILVFNDNREGIGFWESIGWTLRSDISVMSRTTEPGPENGTCRMAHNRGSLP